MAAIVGLLSPVVEQIYAKTIDWHPGFVFCLCCLILIPMIGMSLHTVWSWRVLMKRRELVKAESESQEESYRKSYSVFNELDASLHRF